MPVRFTSPGLGETELPLKKHQWQVDFAYRHLGADKWFVGTQIKESAAPFGHPLFLNINSVDVSVDYGVTDRLSLTLTLPFSYGTHSRFYADGKRHKVSAGGLGDISLVGNLWLWNPARHPHGNLALGLGTKTPSGDNAVKDDFFLADGSVVQRPVDQAVQLGDGGWGVIFQVQGYRQIFKRASGYGYGWYLMSPKDRTSVISPYPGVPLSAPDVYSVRVGTGYAIRPEQGLSVNFGTRIDGIPIRDLVGDSNGFRRPGYSLYLDPGVSLRRGRNTFTVNVPVRVYQDFQRSLIDIQQGRPGGGDLAKVLIFAGYSVRF
jgi:hypothetical protein